MKLYKYLPSKYLDSVITEGALLFRSLSYYQDYEDDISRSDNFDGKLKYSGSNGLEINNLTTGVSSTVPWKFVSKVDAENVFVFCTSKKLSSNLAEEFNADVCIEILRPEIIISKLHSAVSRRKKIKPNKLFHGDVQYYTEDEAPGIKWVFPKKIAMRKLHSFSEQEEYRFMFSANKALDFERTTQEIHINEKEKVRRLLPYPEHVLKIGNIKKWCKIHKFT